MMHSDVVLNISSTVHAKSSVVQYNLQLLTASFQQTCFIYFILFAVTG